MTRPIPLGSVTVLLLLLSLWTGQASAHRVNVFCWTEQDRVACEATFPDGSPISEGSVAVLAKRSGERLLKGQTDAQGSFSFPIPQRAVDNRWDLEVVLEASMGHKNSWTVRAEELTKSPQENAKTNKQNSVVSNKPEQAGDQPQKAGDAPRASLSHDELEELVSAAVSREIAPLERQIQSMKQDRVSLQDILGGLGYILGLMGLGLYLKSRPAGGE